MRDDIGKLPIPASAKRYARMRGPFGTSPAKQALYVSATADIVNGGKTRGFRSMDQGCATAEAAKRVVDALIHG